MCHDVNSQTHGKRHQQPQPQLEACHGSASIVDVQLLAVLLLPPSTRYLLLLCLPLSPSLSLFPAVLPQLRQLPGLPGLPWLVIITPFCANVYFNNVAENFYFQFFTSQWS